MLIVKRKKKKKKKERKKYVRSSAWAVPWALVNFPPPPNFCLFTDCSSPAPQTTHCLFYWCTEAAAKSALGRGPLDGFFNPQTPPPSRYFYLKSICCFQTEIGSRGKFTNRCLSKGSNDTRASPTIGTRGQERIWLSLLASCPLSPCGPAPDSSLKAGKLSQKMKLGDYWFI